MTTDPVHDQIMHADAMYREDRETSARLADMREYFLFCVNEDMSFDGLPAWVHMWDLMDYGDNAEKCMKALVLCANKGNVEAIEALQLLAHQYAENQS